MSNQAGNGRKNISTSGQQQRQRSGVSVSGCGKSVIGHNRNSSENNRNSGISSQQHNTRASSKREEDDGNHVPGTNVVRIMRTILPTQAKISDDAKEAVQECVTEYISLITSEANERCMREHRKTLTPEDLLYAMAKLGFDDYIQPLTLYLNRYRAFESKRNTINGEPTVYRAVNYQHLLAPNQQSPPPPPQQQHHHHLLPPSTLHFNPLHSQIAPPLMYLVNTAQAMRGFQGFSFPPAPPPVIANYAQSVGITGCTATVYPYDASDNIDALQQHPSSFDDNKYSDGNSF